MELIFTGEPMSSADALKWGLINQVVPDGTAVDAALALAERITVNAPLAVWASKRVAMGVDDGVITGDEPGWDQDHARNRDADSFRGRQGGTAGVRREASASLEGALAAIRSGASAPGTTSAFGCSDVVVVVVRRGRRRGRRRRAADGRGDRLGRRRRIEHLVDDVDPCVLGLDRAADRPWRSSLTLMSPFLPVDLDLGALLGRDAARARRRGPAGPGTRGSSPAWSAPPGRP